VIKLVFCIHRRPDLTFEEFDAYWRDVHGPLVRQHAEVLGIRRYVQVPGGYPRVSAAIARGRGGIPVLDGVAEAWYDSIEDFTARGRDPEVQRIAAIVAEDETRFIDLPSSTVLLGDERAIIGAPGAGH
jgi:uncharacterized protein (TIGR02118 family)